VRAGIIHLLHSNQVTPDLGGSLSTQAVTAALIGGMP
jgi:ribose/xylose/arabinose/galactoside ABC-type transport system permease subunit